MLKVGTYKLLVWVKRAGENGVKTDTSGLGSYDNYTIVEFNCVALTDPDLTLAKTDVTALQTAVDKDLAVAENLTGAEALVQPAIDASAKVREATDKISLTDSITLAIDKITTARTAFNATVVY